MDEHMLTGESAPVAKAAGSSVVGGTLNVSNAVVVQATRVGSDTVLQSIARLVANAQLAKAPVQSFADAVSAVRSPGNDCCSFLRRTTLTTSPLERGLLPRSCTCVVVTGISLATALVCAVFSEALLHWILGTVFEDVLVQRVLRDVVLRSR